MECPACARPIAMARATCVYCGAALPEDGLQDAARAARKVLESKNLAGLEAATQGFFREQPPRRYVVIDTTSAPVDLIAEACSVSVWEARQWQAASRYRLLKVSAEPANGPLESGLAQRGLDPLVVTEETVARFRNPILLESIDPLADPPQCTVREHPEGSPLRRDLRVEDLTLIVSAPIKRERVKDPAPSRPRAETRSEEGWLVHLHLRDGTRPFEIDPLRTAYEGAGLSSAYMRTLELVRSLSARAPHDEAFRNIVPALSPGLDPLRNLDGLAPAAKKKDKEPRVVVLDNVAQFREYSAWRGALQALLRERSAARP